jgi:hypothetical protein
MNPSIEAQQRRVVSALVRRNIQGWGRPLDYTVQRLRQGIIFGGLGVVLFFVRQLVMPLGIGFLNTVTSLLTIVSFVFFLSILFTYLVPFLRGRGQTTTSVSGKLEVAICEPQEISPAARGDYHFITLRQSNGVLKAYAIEAGRHEAICALRGQKVTLDIIPGIERVEGIHY